jgi:hypothetical protein
MGQSPIFLSTGRLVTEIVRVEPDSVMVKIPVGGTNVPVGRKGFARRFQLLSASSIQVIILRMLPGADGFPGLQE